MAAGLRLEEPPLPAEVTKDLCQKKGRLVKRPFDILYVGD
jgi:hypothetical protein